MAKGLMQRVTRRSGTLFLGETALVVGAILLSVFLRVGERIWEMVQDEGVLAKSFLIAFACQLCLYYRDLYDDTGIAGDPRELVVRLLQALGATSLILALLYLWFPALVIGRGVFAIAALAIIVLVGAWRALFHWLAGRVGARHRLLLVGTSPAAVLLARELHERRELGVEIVGFVDTDAARVGERVLNPRIVGTIDDIPALVRKLAVDRVVVSLADARGKLPMDKLLDMKLQGVAFDHLASAYEEYTGKIAVETLRPSWVIFSSGFAKSRLLHALKRALDLMSASTAMLLAAPLLLLIAVAVKLTSTGPVLYRQQRVGYHGATFTVHKFRSMRHDAEVTCGAVWSQPGDARITKLGRWLRRTRFDELPQLWNVLRGDMSLVGPRPERPEFVHSLTRQIPFYGQRHVVKPGLTGWAQVRYTYGATVEDAMEKLQYDLFYIKNMSVGLDLFIVFETVKTVLLGRGA